MKITISTITQKDLPLTWEAFTKPEHIVNWYFASPDWHSPRASNNLQVGSSFNIRMEARDQSAGFDFEGFYDEIKVHEKIVYHLADNRVVETTFKKTDSGAHVTQMFDTEDIHSAELQKNGWQSILDNFCKYTNEL